MALFTWDDPGERLYASGLDHGVLYVHVATAVPWNGLTSVEVNPESATITPTFIDGVVVLNVPSLTGVSVNISAFYSPPEFDVCEGFDTTQAGYFAFGQAPKEFDLSWRTYIGTDTEGSEAHERIHLLYNCSVLPATKPAETSSDNTDLEPIEWEASSRPMLIEGSAPTAYFIADSRFLSESRMDELKAVLYGTADAPARMLTAEELAFYFIYITADEPTWTDNTTDGGGSWTTTPTFGLTYSPASGTATPGQTVLVEAIPDEGYSITGESSWSHTFPEAPIIHVTPPPPNWSPDYINGGGSWTTPVVEGITYNPASGSVSGLAIDKTRTVTATASEGYIIDGDSSWTYTFPNKGSGTG